MSDAPVLLDLPPAPPGIAADPVLRRAKAGLRKIYGDRLAGIILYGSRARGDHRPDSDYDLLVLIRDYRRDRDWGPPLYALGDKLFQMEPYEIEINFFPVDATALGRESIFMHNVRDEGIRI